MLVINNDIKIFYILYLINLKPYENKFSRAVYIGGKIFILYTYRNHRSLLILIKMYRDRRLSGAGKLNEDAVASKLNPSKRRL